MENYNPENPPIYAHKSWIVKWRSLHKDIIDNYEPEKEMEIFPVYEDALAFKEALENAIRLLKDASRRVTIEENK